MAKNSFVRAFDDLPWLVKIIFALPILDFLWGIYRIVKGLSEGSLFMVIIGIIWTFVGAAIFWIIDIISIIIFKRPVVFA